MLHFNTQLRNKFCDANSSKKIYRDTSGEINLRKKCDFRVKIVHLHSGGVCFQSLPGQQVFWQNFHDILCYFEANSEVGPQLNKDHFNSDALQISLINQPTIIFFCHGATALVV